MRGRAFVSLKEAGDGDSGVVVVGGGGGAAAAAVVGRGGRGGVVAVAVAVAVAVVVAVVVGRGGRGSRGNHGNHGSRGLGDDLVGQGVCAPPRQHGQEPGKKEEQSQSRGEKKYQGGEMTCKWW